MTTCAVVDATNTVINIIIAEPTDLAPQNCVLILVPDANGNYPNPGSGWTWDGTTFIDPNPLLDYSYAD